ncbi:MAG: aldehyde dehydrogenase family protein [Verrucomicrobiae bacterium]|nr:aldehyde dehydrogenase family protein [Verrucomicrobiae bacterium]
MDFSSLLRQQRASFQTGATRSLEFRRAQLRRLQAALERHEASLLEAIHADLRRAAHDAYLSEIGFVLREIHYALRNLPAWMKPQRRSVPLLARPGRAWVQPEPLGVALILGPWNYPVQLLLLPLVSALAAGNCAVLKPSEFAPHTAEAIARLIRDTFSEDYVAVCPGGRDVAEALLREQFDKIFFTGGTAAGRAVMAAAAKHLTPVTLELGGKCPCLVCADAPLEVTARRIAWGKFMNAGQTCVAPDFVLAEQPIRHRLLEALQRAVREFYGDDPRQSPHYGRIVNRRHFERLTGLLNAGRIVCGGQQDVDTLYLAPTILADVPPDAPVMQEEIFGPILPVLTFEQLDEALAKLADRPTPLALYLFTNDRAVQQRVLARTRSGGVCLNDTVMHLLSKDLPFGGLGESGMGAYHGRAGFEAFSHYRSVLRRGFWPDFRLRYPPPRVGLPTLRRMARWLLGE